MTYMGCMYLLVFDGWTPANGPVMPLFNILSRNANYRLWTMMILTANPFYSPDPVDDLNSKRAPIDVIWNP